MRITARLVVGCPFLFALAAPVPGQEWTRFRGPNGSGVSPEAPVPARWAEEDFNWKVRLPGVGHSSPVVWGERVFVTSGEESTGKKVLVCLRAGDGRVLWSRDYAGPRHGKHPDNSFASATPAVDGRRVYVCWGGADLRVAAVDHDGREVWRADLGPFKAGHGFGASPILHDGLLVVPAEQDGASALYGLDGSTGKVRWKVPRKSRASYSTPCVYQPRGGLAQLIFTSYEHGVTALDPRTGRKLWERDVFDKGHVETCIGSPVVAGDLVLGASGWLGVRQEVVAVRPPGEEAAAREAFRIDRAAPLCTTPLVKGGLLFLWSDGGVVSCADARTGEVRWKERVPGSYYASPVCVGDRLYGVSRQGDVVVLAASERFGLLARNRLGEGSHSTPAVAGGRMYVRTFSHLFSIGGRKTD